MTASSPSPALVVPPNAVAILAPELGSREPIRVTGWRAELGEAVEAGERIVELLVPGVTFEVAAPVAGTLEHIARPSDTEVRPGELLGWITPASDVSA